MSKRLKQYDIGEINSPCLVFGGPYSNLHATRALINQAAKRQISSENIICTGDTVAYCADPQETVDAIRNSGMHVVMGNCEQSLAANAEDCGCGFDEGSSCNLMSVQWYQYSRERLSTDSKRWMGTLPASILFRMHGRKFKVIHGGNENVSRFVFPSTCNDIKQEELDFSACDGIIAGHSGIPFYQILDDKLWYNPGVIGMPANDGSPRVWFGVLSPRCNGIHFETCALDYDYSDAANSMRRNGCVEAYAISLESGVWPADDIMPSLDSESRGIPIKPQSNVWLDL